MSPVRLTFAVILGAATWLLAGNAVQSADSPAKPKALQERPQISDDFQPGDAPPAGPRRPPGPRPRGEGFDNPPPPAGPGPRPEGFPQHPGPLEPGPGPGGPPGLAHPPGAPRWPHEDWESLQKNDPEMYKLLQEDRDLERQARELAMQYRQAPKDQKKDLQQELEGLVTKHFEARQKRRELELKRLEQELQRLRDSIDQRSKAREEIVKRRVSELLGLNDELRF